MYRLSSLNGWFHGMAFESLAQAKEKADAAAQCGVQCDVFRDIDGEMFRAVYSGDSGHLPAIVGTYEKNDRGRCQDEQLREAVRIDIPQH